MSYTYAGRFGPEALIDLQGNVQLGVVVAVYQTDGSPAVLYTNRLKSGTLPNSTSPNALGNLTFFADPGDYDLVAGSTTVRVTVGADPAETAHGGILDPHADRAYADTLAAALDVRIDDVEAGGGSPSGVAGGDLDGTFPNPTIAAGAVGAAELADGAITNAKIAAGAAIAASKLSGVAATAGENIWTGDQYFRSGRPWVDVRAYGAAGNGAGNDTAAIQAAINAAQAMQGVVYFPPGTYITDQLTITGRLTMFGAGMERTILYARIGATGPLINVVFSTPTGTAVTIGGFTIDLNSARTLVGIKADRIDGSVFHDIEVRYGSDAIYLVAANRVLVERVWSVNQTNSVIRAERTDLTSRPNLMFRDIWINTPDDTITLAHGILVQGILAGCTMENVQVMPNDEGGIATAGISILNPGGFGDAYDGQFIFLTNCQTDNITGPGLNLQNVRGVWASNNFFGSKLGNNTPGIKIDGGKEMQFSTNWISGSGVEFLNAPNRVQFTNNIIPQTSAGGAFLMPATDPPTNLMLSQNYFYTNLSDDTAMLAGASPDKAHLPVYSAMKLLTDTANTAPGLVLMNADTGKTKTLRVERGATGTLTFYSDADAIIAQLSDTGNLTLRRPGDNKQRTLALTTAGALQLLANDGSTVTAEVSNTGVLTSGLSHAHEILVAASTATAEVKARAYAVCDATNDEVEIIAAANLVEAAGGGKVILSEGAFNIDAPARKAGAGQMGWTNVTFQGQGRGTRLHNRMDGGGSGDVYVFYAWGANSGAPLIGMRVQDMAFTGQEYTVNTKGQHGVSVHWAEGFSADNLHFSSLSEEGIVLDEGAKYVQIGKLYGKSLGSSVIDMAGCEHVQIDQIFADTVNQVEDSAAVLIFDGSTVGRIPKDISIGKINVYNSGASGVRIVSGEEINIAQVIVEGISSGSRKTSYAVWIHKSSFNPAGRNVNIGQVIARNCGAKTNEPVVRVTDATYLNLHQLIAEGCYGPGLQLNAVSQSHFGQLSIHDPTENAQSPAPGAVELFGTTTVDNTFDQIVIRDWVFAAGDGAGFYCAGLRNIVNSLQVSGDAVVTGADWWDVNFIAGSEHNLLVSAVISGHGTGKITDAGTGNKLGLIVGGTAGASYKPYTGGGTATIASGATTVDVTHGLGFTPAARNIRLTPTNNLGAASHWWVSNLGATTFRINLDADPTADATFEWSAGPV